MILFSSMVRLALSALAFGPLLLPGASAQCWQNVACDGPTEAAFPGKWDANIYSPSTRVVSPASVLQWCDLSSSTTYGPGVTLSGNGSLVTFDFGKEVGGIISFDYTATSSGRIGVAFSEAKSFIGEWSDSSNGAFKGPDGALYAEWTGSAGNASYSMPQEQLRGGFRYMTMFLMTNSSAKVTVTNVTAELSFAPTWPKLNAYQGYFHSNDELLNRIWYAGAYTIQTNSVPVNTGRQVPFLTTGWANNATLGPGDTIIVDGAKRDRAVWPGDMGIAVPSGFVSLGDLASIKNALQVMYNYQSNKTGAFDESGPPLSQKGSDTYHMWTMIGTYNYFLYTNDTDFLNQNWQGYQRAMAHVLGEIDSSGLMNVTGIRDWARWQQGFHNTEANMILYHTLNTGAKLATWLGGSNNTALATSWSDTAASLRAAINSACFDAMYGAYKDNDTATTLYPQDANSLSLLFSIPGYGNSSTPAATPSSLASTIASIATKLIVNWTPIGPVTPELPYNVSPFISSFELLGRLTQRDTARALELLRTTWGWIINNKNSTESTLLEGYLYNGSFSYRSNRGYGYDPTYPSHSHGWSAGPTSGMTNFILGLDVTEPAGSVWSLAPQWGDLTSVEGGFTTSLGKFSAKWARGSDENVTLSWATPSCTTGVVTVAVPLSSSCDGLIVQSNGDSVDLAMNVAYSTSIFGETLASISVQGGNGTLTIS